MFYDDNSNIYHISYTQQDDLVFDLVVQLVWLFSFFLFASIMKAPEFSAHVPGETFAYGMLFLILAPYVLSLFYSASYLLSSWNTGRWELRRWPKVAASRPKNANVAG